MLRKEPGGVDEIFEIWDCVWYLRARLDIRGWPPDGHFQSDLGEWKRTETWRLQAPGAGNSVTIQGQETSIQVPAEIQTSAAKHPYTSFRSEDINGKQQLEEVDLGGTKTTIRLQIGIERQRGRRVTACLHRRRTCTEIGRPIRVNSRRPDIASASPEFRLPRTSAALDRWAQCSVPRR